MNEQRHNPAPLFNLEHLLSKPIPQLVGSGINLCTQIVKSGLVLAGLSCSQLYVVIRCRFTRQLVLMSF